MYTNMCVSEFQILGYLGVWLSVCNGKGETSLSE